MFCKGFSIRQQRLMGLVALLAGILCLPVALFAPVDDRTRGFFTGMGSALILVGLVQSIRLFRISRDPEKVRDYEVSRNEERTRFILDQSIRMTFFVSIVAEYLAGIASLLLGQHVLGMGLCCLVIGQTAVVLLLRQHYGKKY